MVLIFIKIEDVLAGFHFDTLSKPNVDFSYFDSYLPIAIQLCTVWYVHIHQKTPTQTLQVRTLDYGTALRYSCTQIKVSVFL